jgi:hypothetical protein
MAKVKNIQQQEDLITRSVNEPCAAEIKTAMLFSVELCVINFETDRKQQCLLYLPLEFIKYSSHICWCWTQTSTALITKHKYREGKH